MLESAGVDIRSALVSTLGSEAVDVFYLAGADGGPLHPERAEQLARRLSADLDGPAQDGTEESS